MKTVLVLGIEGMLGSMVYKYLSLNTELRVIGTLRNNTGEALGENVFHFEINEGTVNRLNELLSIHNPDYIINCIGVINKYCNSGGWMSLRKAVEVNTYFPHHLAQVAIRSKIIQIATDCVFSGRDGNYDEHTNHDGIDIYGKTKSLGEVDSQNFLNIRCSIIGPELKGKTSLMEWFLSHAKGAQVNGYSNHYWNGVTTLQFAQFCETIIHTNTFFHLRGINSVIHFCPNPPCTKYELLQIINSIFQSGIQINKQESSTGLVNRILISRYLKIPICDLYNVLSQLKEFTS